MTQFERHIAIVDSRQIGKDIDAKGILRVAVENSGSAADRLRPEAGARPVGDGDVERDAENRDIDPGQVAAVAPPHER